MTRRIPMLFGLLTALALTSGAVVGEQKADDWMLDIGAGALEVRAGGIADAVEGMAGSESSRFAMAYGTAPDSMLYTCGHYFGVAHYTLSLRRRVGEDWGWRVGLDPLREFTSEAKIDMTGMGGQTLRQKWTFDANAVPVSAGLWKDAETRRGLVLRGRASMGVTLIRACLSVDRRFSGGGRNDHYGAHYPLSGWAPALDVSGSLGYRFWGWCEPFLEAGYFVVSPATLAFQNDADTNMDGRTEYYRGEELTDRSRSDVTLDFSGGYVLLGLGLSL